MENDKENELKYSKNEQPSGTPEELAKMEALLLSESSLFVKEFSKGKQPKVKSCFKKDLDDLYPQDFNRFEDTKFDSSPTEPRVVDEVDLNRIQRKKLKVYHLQKKRIGKIPQEEPQNIIEETKKEEQIGNGDIEKAEQAEKKEDNPLSIDITILENQNNKNGAFVSSKSPKNDTSPLSKSISPKSPKSPPKSPTSPRLFQAFHSPKSTHSPEIEKESDDKKKTRIKLIDRIKMKKITKLEQKQSATLIQAHWRGYSLRKKISKHGEISSLVKQLNAIRHLIIVEGNYVGALSSVITNVLLPLKEMNFQVEEFRKKIPTKVIESIFRNIESIYTAHQQFLTQLEKQLDLWPFTTEIPITILKMCGNFTHYVKYAEGASNTEETLQFYRNIIYEYLNKFSELQSSFEKHQFFHFRTPLKKFSFGELNSILCYPYTHIGKDYNTCAYLLRVSPKSFIDIEMLADAVAIMSQLKKFIWNIADVSISKRKVEIIGRKIKSDGIVSCNIEGKPRVITLSPNLDTPLVITKKEKEKRKLSLSKRRKITKSISEGTCPSSSIIHTQENIKLYKEMVENQNIQQYQQRNSSSTFELYSPNRKLIRNGPLIVDDNKRHVFLFNDACLILRVLGVYSSIFDASFEFQNARIVSNQLNSESQIQTFTILTEKNVAFTFTEKINPHRGKDRTWLENFENVIQQSNDKIFGRPLADVVEKNQYHGIPEIVYLIIQSLHKHLTCQGLFQAPGNVNVIQSFRDPSNLHKLQSSNPHDIVGLLIFYLEQLPDLLLPFINTDPIFTAQSYPNQKNFFQWAKQKLREMSEIHRNLLEYITHFLLKVLEKSKYNGVTFLDLSVTFAPLLLRPKEVTLEYCYKMPRVIRLVKFLIEKSHQIFANPKIRYVNNLLSHHQFAPSPLTPHSSSLIENKLEDHNDSDSESSNSSGDEGDDFSETDIHDYDYNFYLRESMNLFQPLNLSNLSKVNTSNPEELINTNHQSDDNGNVQSSSIIITEITESQSNELPISQPQANDQSDTTDNKESQISLRTSSPKKSAFRKSIKRDSLLIQQFNSSYNSKEGSAQNNNNNNTDQDNNNAEGGIDDNNNNDIAASRVDKAKSDSVVVIKERSAKLKIQQSGDQKEETQKGSQKKFFRKSLKRDSSLLKQFHQILYNKNSSPSSPPSLSSGNDDFHSTTPESKMENENDNDNDNSTIIIIKNTSNSQSNNNNNNTAISPTTAILNDNIGDGGGDEENMVRRNRSKSTAIIKVDDNETEEVEIEYRYPDSILEFLEAKQFDVWWRDYRQNSPTILSYLNEKNNLYQLLQILLNTPDYIHDPNDRTMLSSSLAFDVLVNSNLHNQPKNITTLLYLISLILENFDLLRTKYNASKSICDLLLIIFNTNSSKSLRYLHRNHRFAQLIARSIEGEVFCAMILNISETFQSNEKLHSILVALSVEIIPIFIEATESSTSELLSNSIRILRSLLRSPQFMNSPLSSPFLESLDERSVLEKLALKIHSPDLDTCITSIPFVIELLVQFKLRQFFPGSLYAMISDPNGSDNGDDHHHHMLRNFPLIAIFLLKYHRKFTRILREPLLQLLNDPQTIVHCDPYMHFMATTIMMTTRDSYSSSRDPPILSPRDPLAALSPRSISSLSHSLITPPQYPQYLQPPINNNHNVGNQSHSVGGGNNNNNNNNINSSAGGAALSSSSSPSLSSAQSNHALKFVPMLNFGQKKSAENIAIISDNKKNDRNEIINIDDLKIDINNPNSDDVRRTFVKRRGRGVPLGFYRLGIVKVVQALVVVNNPLCNVLLTKTELLGACLDLFFVYYHHSVLHSVVAYIIRFIFTVNMTELIDALFCNFNLIEKILEVYSMGPDSPVYDNLKGYLRVISYSIINNSYAKEIASMKENWNNYITYIIKEDQKSGVSTQKEEKFNVK